MYVINVRISFHLPYRLLQHFKIIYSFARSSAKVSENVKDVTADMAELQRESCKGKQDVSKIKSLLQVTFHHRTQAAEDKPVDEFFTLAPCLQDLNFVSKSSHL